MNKKVLVLGATGQDGSFLVDELLARGCSVYALVRKASTSNMTNLQAHMSDDHTPKNQNLTIVRGDVLDHARTAKLIDEIQPDYIFNEADQDHVAWSVDIPCYSLDVTTKAAINIFESVKQFSPQTSIFQPVSSNMFGNVDTEMQNEETPVKPVSPYGIAKAATFQFANYYRSAFGLKICTGILYNHESHRRQPAYLSRKVTKAVAEISMGKRKSLTLGNLSGYVDWGYAPEFMEIAADLLMSGCHDNYIIGTGQLTLVGDFVKNAFASVNLDWKDHVKYDAALERPIKTGNLRADTGKLEKDLGRVPMVGVKEIIQKMVSFDMEVLA